MIRRHKPKFTTEQERELDHIEKVMDHARILELGSIAFLQEGSLQSGAAIEALQEAKRLRETGYDLRRRIEAPGPLPRPKK